MLCKYLIDIYNNHIHSQLIDDELFYSKQCEKNFLDVWDKIIFEEINRGQYKIIIENKIVGKTINGSIFSFIDLDLIIFGTPFNTDHYYNFLIKKHNLKINE
jgi:hypothetical protein